MKTGRLDFIQVLLASLLLLISMGTAAQASTWQVTMGSDDLFHPDILTIAVGDSITWTNADEDNHTSTSGPPDCTPDGLWDSGDVVPGASFTLGFGTAGVFQYYCTHHCMFGMVGTITVEELTPDSQTTWGHIKAVYR